ncbi:hypothetical protein [Micromonospora sp. WMMD812]|uniref:hypothetical protein n=1 Tax=Micromonospora sp. WMMD812 TaxID=3015152 RepID=UPI00248C8E6D|nr:hypothetical protein [Micromonospora sp. WMMD812]WBB64869.1 hypothetical protein O7603_16690 [Micromonospora sp. WMMD812]
MAVRRHTARLATVCAVLGGLVMVGASPALADDDSVRVRSASSFTAGGSAQGVTVEVRKRSEGCVLLRTALGLRLAGLGADQVTVHVSYGGRWFPVPVGGGSGQVATSQTSPAKPNLCKGKGITVRYRVAFAAGAPDGRLSVTGEATDAMGRALGRAADSSRVVGGRASASPTPSKKPSPTPTPVATEAATDGDSTPAALAEPSGGGGGNSAAEESSGLSPVMFIGLALVVAGALLIVLLVRRFREDKASTDEPGALGDPGGNTYRSAGGASGGPGWPGQVYGQPPAAGGTYGAPRPAGGVYGARPDAAPDPTRPLPGQWSEPTQLGPTLSGPTAPGPSAGPGAPPSAPGQPDVPPAPSGGGDHTVYMPRL